MPRNSDPKANSTLSVKARGESEKKVIADLKKLANQDGIDVVDLFFESVDLLFKVHHWPPGNPQQQIIRFTQEKIEPAFKCCKCGRAASKSGYHIPSKKNLDYCDSCFKEVPMRYDGKVWVFKKVGGVLNGLS